MGRIATLQAHLTDELVRDAAPADKRYRIWDDAGIPGFCVQVSTAGSRTYLLVAQDLDDRQRNWILGKSPEVLAEDARRLAVYVHLLLDKAKRERKTCSLLEAIKAPGRTSKAEARLLGAEEKLAALLTKIKRSKS